MKNKAKKSKCKPSAPTPHGAVKTCTFDGEVVRMATSAAIKEEYPVMFTVEQLPALIRWLQACAQQAGGKDAG